MKHPQCRNASDHIGIGAQIISLSEKKLSFFAHLPSVCAEPQFSHIAFGELFPRAP
jgi:hypothetical protein